MYLISGLIRGVAFDERDLKRRGLLYTQTDWGNVMEKTLLSSDCISGVMVRVLTLSAVDRGFETRSTSLSASTIKIQLSMLI
jgi:hypothetical protein